MTLFSALVEMKCFWAGDWFLTAGRAAASSPTRTLFPQQLMYMSAVFITINTTSVVYVSPTWTSTSGWPLVSLRHKGSVPLLKCQRACRDEGCAVFICILFQSVSVTFSSRCQFLHNVAVSQVKFWFSYLLWVMWAAILLTEEIIHLHLHILKRSAGATEISFFFQLVDQSSSSAQYHIKLVVNTGGSTAAAVFLGGE